MADVTIIIVSYNSEFYLNNCLESVYEQTKNIYFNVILIDNNSTDKSINIIKSNFREIKIIENKTNYGFAKAVNQGLELTDSEYILLLNPDTILLNNAIKVYYDFMQATPSAGCCGGTILEKNMNPGISFGFFPTLKQIFFEEFGLRKIFTKYYFNHLSPACKLKNENSKPISVDYVSGANMFFKKNVLNKAGKLDEDFFLYYEETELSFRIKKSGFKNFVVPEAKIIHLEGKSFAGDDFNKIKLMKKSEFLFFRKCYGSFSVFCAKLFYITGSVLKLIFKFDKRQLKIFKVIINS